MYLFHNSRSRAVQWGSMLLLLAAAVGAQTERRINASVPETVDKSPGFGFYERSNTPCLLPGDRRRIRGHLELNRSLLQISGQLHVNPVEIIRYDWPLRVIWSEFI